MQVNRFSVLLARPVHDEAAQPEAAYLLVKDQVRPLGPHRLSGAEFGGKLDEEPQPGIGLGKRGEDRRNLAHLVAGPRGGGSYLVANGPEPLKGARPQPAEVRAVLWWASGKTRG